VKLTDESLIVYYRPAPPADLKQPDKKLKARGLNVYISDIRNCKTREQEEERVFQELANIRAKFSQKANKPLTSYDRKKYVWKLVYTHLLGYDVDFGHMQAIELLAGTTFSEKLCGYLAISVLLKGTDELMTLVVNTIKRDLSLKHQEAVQCLALCAIANIGGRDMAQALADDVRRLVVTPATPVAVRKKAVLALLRIHRETPRVVRLPTELEVAQMVQQEYPVQGGLGLALSATALLKHVIELANEQDKRIEAREQGGATIRRRGSKGGGDDDEDEDIDLDPEEEKAREVRLRQRPQIQAIVVRLFHALAVHFTCPPEYMYHGTAAPFLQVALLQILLAIGKPPTAAEIREPLYEGLRKTLAGVKWSKSSTINNASRCVAFEAIALIVSYGKDSRADMIDSCIELLGRFAASKNANTRFLALGSMTNIARTVAQRYTSHKEAAMDQWQRALSNQQSAVVASLKDPDNSVRKRALDLLFHVCDEHNANEVISELLSHLQDSMDLQPEFKEEMVLRIAVLAERHAKSSRWYLEKIIRLLEGGGEHAGDDVWHRVVQIIANQEDLQQYAALRMYKALLQPGHVPDSMVKVASYVIGEFGYLLTEYSTLETGDLDHDVLPIDLFGACHRHFVEAEPLTKIVLLTTYSKLLNIYEDLQVPVEEVFESQKRSIHPEVQQRACEYAALARLNEDTMHHVLEPMPPWPEHTENKLEQHLEMMDKGIAANSEKQPVAVVAAQVSPRAPAKSTSTSSPRTSDDRQDAIRKVSEQLLDLDDGDGQAQPPPPRPEPNSPSSMKLKQYRKLYMNALLTPKSLLFDDGGVQIGSYQQFQKGVGTVDLFVGNLSQTTAIDSVSFEFSNPEVDAIEMAVPPSAQRGERFLVAPGSQAKFAFVFKCRAPFMASPEVILVHHPEGHHIARVKFPIALGSFLEPFSLPNTTFEERWTQLEHNPSLCASKTAQLNKLPSEHWPQAVQKAARLVELSRGARVASWPMAPVMDTHDFAGGAMLQFAEGGGNCGVLMRIEVNEGAQVGRVSVRATMPDVANCLLVGLFNQLIRLFGDE